MGHSKNECALLKFSSNVVLCDSVPDKCLCESCITRIKLNLYIPLKVQILYEIRMYVNKVHTPQHSFVTLLVFRSVCASIFQNLI